MAHTRHTHIITLSMTDIMKRAMSQSSADFRALRSAGTEQSAAADSIYEDFVIKDDDMQLVIGQVHAVVPQIYQAVRAYSPHYYTDDDSVVFGIDSDDCNAGQRLSELLLNSIVYAILGWWYELRAAELSSRYYDKSQRAIGDILSVVIPMFYERRLRYF